MRPLHTPADIGAGPVALPALLQSRAGLGDRHAIHAPDLTLSYAAAPAFAAAAAGRLAAAGIGPGDRVAVMLPNGADLLATWLGTAWLGAVFVPLNTALRGAQLRHALGVSAPALVLADDLHRPLVTDALSQAGMAVDCRAPAMLDAAPAVLAAALGPGDPAALLFTSGTTGPSKAVICPHGQLWWWGVLTGAALGIKAGDVLYTCLPQFHTNALNSFVQALVYGATWRYGQRFSASRWWQECADTGATVVYLLGTMAEILLRRPAAEANAAHRVRVCLSPGTAPASVDGFRDRFGVRIVDGYGSTETNLVLSNSLDGFVPGCMGRPAPQFEVCVADAADRPVRRGEAGELLVRPREPFSMASGYFGDAPATVAAWRNLWFHTGDTVRQDEDGCFHFFGRAKDAIRRRGENISAWEVEQALLEHEDVVETAVVGVASELGEEEVLAWVRARPGAVTDAAALLAFLRPRMAAFALPRYLCFVDALPRTDNGKIRKAALREQGLPATAWDREADPTG